MGKGNEEKHKEEVTRKEELEFVLQISEEDSLKGRRDGMYHFKEGKTLKSTYRINGISANQIIYSS